MNNTQKFTGKAKLYNSSRPNYPQEFMDYLCLMGIKKGSKVADIGSGTGIFTEQLLSLGAEVYAVEPNDEMRNFAESNLCRNSNFHSINSTAENTSLENNSLDFITVAQAFHWFDVKLFKKECNRILKKDGKVILVWNSRIPNTQYSIDRDLMFKEYCTNYFGGGISEGLQKDVNDFFTSHEKITFNNDMVNSNEDFIKYTLSLSYTPRPEDEKYNDFIKALDLFVEKYSQNGIIITPTETNAYIGEL